MAKMVKQVLVLDPTTTDEASRVRGVGRYLQILRENFSHSAEASRDKPSWQFTDQLSTLNSQLSTLINPFINFLQPPIITKRLTGKQIAVIHDLIPLKYPSHFPAGVRGTWNIVRNKHALKHYDLFVTDSEASKKDIITMLKIPADNIHVIYPTLPKLFLNSKSEIRNPKQFSKFENSNLFRVSSFEPRNYFIYVGDVTWNKNLVNLARAIKIADVPCVFVGKAFNVSRSTFHVSQNSWLQEFNEFQRLAQGDKRFIFPGFVEDKELVTLYKKAVANILISRDEGFGLSYLEAAACGMPSVLSDIPIFHEIARDTALFVDPENTKTLTHALRQPPTPSKKLRERASFFSIEKFIEQWEEVLTK